MIRLRLARHFGTTLLVTFVSAAGCGAPLSLSALTHTGETKDTRLAEGRAEAVDIQDIKLPVLLERIANQQGKVVVVDTWASWCVPCKREFPHLVELARRHPAGEVACMSVSIDKSDGSHAALAFLKKMDAQISNYRVEEGDAWLEKWGIRSIPVVLVFGRDGKLARKFDKDNFEHPFTYDDVGRLVDQLLESPQ
jgi:YD repeat-containing protein